MTGETSGKIYISCGFEHPNISARKVYANLDPRKGAKDKNYPLIWNPRS